MPWCVWVASLNSACMEGAAGTPARDRSLLQCGPQHDFEINMKAICYRNTKTTLLNWAPIHDQQSRGIAYETESHFVHFYGTHSDVWAVSTGLTVTEKKSGSLRDWAKRVFGAEDIEDVTNDIGNTISGVWRPALLHKDEVLQGLQNTESERRLAEQALFILIQRLDEILLFVEPTPNGLATFGHKSRELLILACTEVENNWTHYMKRAGIRPNARNYTTQDYVKLHKPLFLDEFGIALPLYPNIPLIRSFSGWDAVSPTQSLGWYDAYNKTKHDRSAYFELATVENAIKAVVAALVMFCVRFSPLSLFQEKSMLSTLSHQVFSLKLNATPTTFYVPLIDIAPNQLEKLVCYNSTNKVKPWRVLPFRL